MVNAVQRRIGINVLTVTTKINLYYSSYLNEVENSLLKKV